MNGHFVGCFIYTDDITLLAPSRDALNNMLDVCREYAEAYDILFNATKTKCIFLIELIVLCLIQMLNSWEALYVLLINVFFLGFTISRDILNRDIQLSINTFNRKM